MKTKIILNWDGTIQDLKYWSNVCKLAKTNPTLQSALDDVKVIYELCKPFEGESQWTLPKN